MKRIATALTCAAALALSLGAPAYAEPETDHAGATGYTLEILSSEGGLGGVQDSDRRTALDCDPAGGSHPRAEEACRLIDEHGDIASVRMESGGVCTLEYRPVTVRVTGAEEYQETFGNECAMKNTKGAVFDF
ncbi:SSI family serine proteinase inhibitor [Nocardiopsis ganjiahuensis]|uniref:SSI family serine proteinase inhibitor n=1 Tax=Nocardiopsis ganjiahuensis TaxID=239984 RepID=UPI00034546BC|nr:SSI family serine proteinase inhibitor [Nocardiopsis ganjiahuensis]